MSTPVQAAMRWAMVANNRSARAADATSDNPRPLAPLAWNTAVEARATAIRREWDAFVRAGGRLPRIEQVLGEHQGNEGGWRAGLLVSHGRTVAPLAGRFPDTVAALAAVPGLLSALFSVLEPGAELPEHQGPNAGVLRYHLGVVSNPLAAVRVAGRTIPYVEGRGILFDDTAPHAAWNHGDAARVTIMCELLRPLPTLPALLNRAVQGARALDPRFRLAPRRAAAWDRAYNPWPDEPRRRGGNVAPTATRER